MDHPRQVVKQDEISVIILVTIDLMLNETINEKMQFEFSPKQQPLKKKK